MNRPLTGVKVLEVDTFTAASACGRLLAEWGAEVIKVEAVNGEPGRTVAGLTFGAPCKDEENPSFECNNAYKKSLALNLKDPRCLDVVHKLADKCNVFLTNYRPNVLKRMGLDFESFHEKHPKTVWAQLTGYGENGPDKDAPGYDAVAFWSRSGVLIDAADKGETPLVPPIGFGDRTTSCTFAGAICAALYHQAVTGEGQKVSVSLYGQALWNIGESIVCSQYGDTFPKTRDLPSSPLANSYRASDGNWFFISCYNYPGQIGGVLKAIDRSDLMDDPRFANLPAARKHCAEVVNILESEFEKHDLAYWIEKMTECDVPFSPVRHFKDVFDDEQAFINDYLRKYSHRNGKVIVGTQSPAKFPETGTDEYVNAPLLGADSLEYLKLAGLSDDEIDAMKNDGVTIIL